MRISTPAGRPEACLGDTAASCFRGQATTLSEARLGHLCYSSEWIPIGLRRVAWRRNSTSSISVCAGVEPRGGSSERAPPEQRRARFDEATRRSAVDHAGVGTGVRAQGAEGGARKGRPAAPRPIVGVLGRIRARDRHLVSPPARRVFHGTRADSRCSQDCPHGGERRKDYGAARAF